MNTAILNAARVRTGGRMATDDSAGFNGLFLLRIDGTVYRIIASDGMGWQHVSVSIPAEPEHPPTWHVMCVVKDLFWNEHQTVMQLHPPKADHVNNHAGCLHLWRPVNGAKIPRPPKTMVGIQSRNIQGPSRPIPIEPIRA